MRANILIALILGVCLAASPVHAQTKASPGAQTGVFAKVFKFTKAFRGKKIKVLGVYDEGTKADVEAMMEAFSGRRVNAQAVGFGDAAGNLVGVHVVYLLVPNDSLEALLKSNKILSITGDSSLVEGGQASVGVMDNSGKMVITVNLPHAKSEGHTFAPSFLKLTKVIR